MKSERKLNSFQHSDNGSEVCRRHSTRERMMDIDSTVNLRRATRRLTLSSGKIMRYLMSICSWRTTWKCARSTSRTSAGLTGRLRTSWYRSRKVPWWPSRRCRHQSATGPLKEPSGPARRGGQEPTRLKQSYSRSATTDHDLWTHLLYRKVSFLPLTEW